MKSSNALPQYPRRNQVLSNQLGLANPRFTGSDRYGAQVRLLPGWLTEPGITQDSITLNFPTFSSTAEQAGFSRVLGGYHIMVDNVEGLAMGRKVAEVVFRVCEEYIHGTSKNSPRKGP